MRTIWLMLHLDLQGTMRTIWLMLHLDLLQGRR